MFQIINSISFKRNYNIMINSLNELIKRYKNQFEETEILIKGRKETSFRRIENKRFELLKTLYKQGCSEIFVKVGRAHTLADGNVSFILYCNKLYDKDS